MAGLELTGQLAILDAALQRLEGELAGDATWCALQSAGNIDEAERELLTAALESNPIYLAWRNMREIAAMLLARQAEGAAEADALPAQTLAQALHQIAESEVASAALPSAEIAPGSVTKAAVARVEEGEHHDVGLRATQTVDDILSMAEGYAEPTPISSEPLQPEAPQVVPPTPPALATSAPPVVPDAEDDIGHSVPLEAADLAFLLSPASRSRSAAGIGRAPGAPPLPPTPPPASPTGEEGPRPFLKRLLAETQTATTKAAPAPPAVPSVIEPAQGEGNNAKSGDAPSADAPAAAPEATADEAAAKPRLARLLKAWSRT